MDSLAALVAAYRSAPNLEAKRGAANDIVCEIHPKLWIFVRGRVGSDHDAEDILQDVFVGVFKGLPNFRGNTSAEFWGFCYRVARNKLATFIDRSAKNPADTVLDDSLLGLLETSMAVDAPSPGERMDLQDALAILAAARPDCVLHLRMRFVEDLSYKEMGLVLAAAEDTVRQRVERCLKRLETIILNRD